MLVKPLRGSLDRVLQSVFGIHRFRVDDVRKLFRALARFRSRHARGDAVGELVRRAEAAHLRVVRAQARSNHVDVDLGLVGGVERHHAARAPRILRSDPLRLHPIRRHGEGVLVLLVAVLLHLRARGDRVRARGATRRERCQRGGGEQRAPGERHRRHLGVARLRLGTANRRRHAGARRDARLRGDARGREGGHAGRHRAGCDSERVPDARRRGLATAQRASVWRSRSSALALLAFGQLSRDHENARSLRARALKQSARRGRAARAEEQR